MKNVTYGNANSFSSGKKNKRKCEDMICEEEFSRSTKCARNDSNMSPSANILQDMICNWTLNEFESNKSRGPIVNYVEPRLIDLYSFLFVKIPLFFKF